MPAILLVLEQILFKLLGFDTDICHAVLHSVTGNVSVASQVVLLLAALPDLAPSAVSALASGRL